MTDRDTILVCGSATRNSVGGWTDIDTIHAWVMPLFLRRHVRYLAHGDADGADRMSELVLHDYAMAGMRDAEVERFISESVRRYPVDTTIDGPWPAAGPKRNARMLAAELPRIRRVLAFTTPGPKLGMTRGTADMVERCVRAGLPVTIVTPGSRP
jgi:hypothetical protein